jgi:hypothetical protein
MKNLGLTYSALGVLFIAAAVCPWAWAQTAQGVAEPAAQGGPATVHTHTTPAVAPAETVTPVKQATKTLSVRHEAVMDAAGNIVGETVVKTAPPEPKSEAVPTEKRPDDSAVWVPGYWQWDAGKANYDWVPGTWRRAIPGMTWTAGRWAKVANGYEWLPGFWTGGSDTTTTKGSTTTRTIIAPEAPPAPREESIPVSPGADLTWIPGYWTYERGGYAWVPGHWERPLAASMIWLPPRWVQTPEGYGILPGHWDYPAEARVYLGSTQRNE